MLAAAVLQSVSSHPFQAGVGGAGVAVFAWLSYLLAGFFVGVMVPGTYPVEIMSLGMRSSEFWLIPLLVLPFVLPCGVVGLPSAWGLKAYWGIICGTIWCVQQLDFCPNRRIVWLSMGMLSLSMTVACAASFWGFNAIDRSSVRVWGGEISLVNRVFSGQLSVLVLTARMTYVAFRYPRRFIFLPGYEVVVVSGEVANKLEHALRAGETRLVAGASSRAVLPLGAQRGSAVGKQEREQERERERELEQEEEKEREPEPEPGPGQAREQALEQAHKQAQAQAQAQARAHPEQGQAWGKAQTYDSDLLGGARRGTDVLVAHLRGDGVAGDAPATGVVSAPAEAECVHLLWPTFMPVTVDVDDTLSRRVLGRKLSTPWWLCTRFNAAAWPCAYALALCALCGAAPPLIPLAAFTALLASAALRSASASVAVASELAHHFEVWFMLGLVSAVAAQGGFALAGDGRAASLWVLTQLAVPVAGMLADARAPSPPELLERRTFFLTYFAFSCAVYVAVFLGLVVGLDAGSVKLLGVMVGPLQTWLSLQFSLFFPLLRFVVRSLGPRDALVAARGLRRVVVDSNAARVLRAASRAGRSHRQSTLPLGRQPTKGITLKEGAAA